MDQEKYAYRKRSSLKTKYSFSSEHLLDDWNKPKKLQWDVQVQETDQQKLSDSKPKFKEADTHYIEVVIEIKLNRLSAKIIKVGLKFKIINVE